MKISTANLRKLIKEELFYREFHRDVLNEMVDEDRTHRCFDGTVVPFGSNECLEDLHQRKEDAQETRNTCNIRTDKRDYYNGVLKVLRREIRDAEKINGALQTELPEEAAL